MKLDALKQFSRLRDTLLHERTLLEERLAQINAIVGPAPATELSNPTLALRGPRRSRGRRRRNGLSLRHAIIKVTSGKPLTKEEILEAVKKLGYRFSTHRPMASINAYLYQKGAFVRRNGRFAPGSARR